MYDLKKLTSDEYDTYNVPYDYESIMHYGQYARAIDKTKPTITPVFSKGLYYNSE
jgi:hypothetical protein